MRIKGGVAVAEHPSTEGFKIIQAWCKSCEWRGTQFQVAQHLVDQRKKMANAELRNHFNQTGHHKKDS